MKVSLFVELAMPRPWEQDTERILVQNTLDQIELADELGFHAVWATEHHFLEEYAHSAAPETLLAAASQRTKNIRMGLGIMNTLPGINHPLRVAERVATLDLVSNGRVEFGSGEGSSAAELDGFRVDPGHKRAMWREGLEIAVSGLADNPFPGVDGKYVQAPPRNVVPKPVQRPHPPLWMACTRRETIRVAAQNGLGVLCFLFLQPEACIAWLKEYHSILEKECVPLGRTVNPRMAAATVGLCAPTTEEAVERGLEGAMSFQFMAGHYYRTGDHQPGVTDIWAKYEQEVNVKSMPADRKNAVLENMGAIGSPDRIRDWLRRYEECGLDEVLLIMQHGKTKHEHIMESIELIGREVLPEFIERDKRQDEERQRTLQPVIDLALARKPPVPTVPEGYSFGPQVKSWEDGRILSGMADALVDLRERRERLPSDGVTDPEAEASRGS